MKNPTHKPSHHPALRGLACALAASALSAGIATATPYASGLTNNGTGTMSFIVNEGGGNITITYEDGSTNANYNGITTGTNAASGAHTFSVVGHTSYSISIFKAGTGGPTKITDISSGASNGLANVTGVDVNRHPSSPYFGRVYLDESFFPTSGQSGAGIWAFNPDLTTNTATFQAAGVPWSNNGNGSGSAPWRLSVGDDDYLTVGIRATNNSGIYRIDPTLSSNVLVLGPAAFGMNDGSYGSIWSRPILVGNPKTGPASLYWVDGDLPTPFSANGFNSLLVDTNITLDDLPWTNAPDISGPNIEFPSLQAQTLFNVFPGLQIPGNGLIYASTYRLNLAYPIVQIYTNDPANGFPQVWNSLGGPTVGGSTGDYFLTQAPGASGANGVTDIAVSPDLKFLAGVTPNNWFVICPLTNGMPDVGNLYVSTPTNFTSGGPPGLTSATAFDVADNLYLSSSGIGTMEEWSLGITTTAVTTGNTNGSTGFSLTLPANSVSVTAPVNFASQGGSDGIPGTPIPGMFTITRTNANGDYSTPMVINFTLSGTATNGVYTTSPSAGITVAGAGSVTLPPGVLSSNIMIIPTTDNVPRLQTTVILSVLGGAAYSVSQPSTATVYIQNTSTNQLVVTAGAPSMYNALSNDFASAVITRLGDTNAPAYNVTGIVYTGTALSGVDFTAVPTMTFNPGDITHSAMIFPLSNGVPPVHVVNPIPVGNKTVTLGVLSGNGYTTNGANATTMTIIDAAYSGGVLLYSDPLTSASEGPGNGWRITFGTSDEPDEPANYEVDFGYDMTTNNVNYPNNGLIPLPPGGADNALRVTCCKQSVSQTHPGGVNVYYTGRSFSGNYAVRFNMNVIESFQNPTEGVLLGMNHNGIETNWAEGSGLTVAPSGPWTADGVWNFIQAPPGGSGGVGFSDYAEFTGAGPVTNNTGWLELNTAKATSYENIFKHSVFTAPGSVTGGTPANNSPLGPSPNDTTWSDVEMRQVQNVVTLSIDKSVIFNYTNTSGTTSMSTNGFVMFGYDCPFGGVLGSYLGGFEAAAYFANLQVFELSPEIVAQPASSIIVTQGANITITNTANYGTAPITNVWYQGVTSAVLPLQTNTSASSGFTSTFTLNNEQKGTNYFSVFRDAAGSVTSSVVVVEVIQGPTNGTVNAGANFRFRITPIGQALPSSVQWQFNGTNITNGSHYLGATTAALTIENVQASDAGTYSAVVVNSGGTVTPSATLTVNATAPTSAVVAPANQTSLWGSTVSFSVTSQGGAPTSYQWQQGATVLSNGGVVSGATSNVLTLTGIRGANAGSYTAAVTNSAGGTVSSAGLLSVFVPAPTFSNVLLSGGNLVMSFMSTNQFDTTNAFVLQRATNVRGPYSNVAGGIFSSNAGNMQVTIPYTGGTEFYRLEHVQ